MHKKAQASKLEFGHARNRPWHFFHLFIYLLTSQFAEVSFKYAIKFRNSTLDPKVLSLNYARTDEKDIFANHFTENIYKVIHEQIKQTKQCVTLFSSLLELGKLTLGWAVLFFQWWTRLKKFLFWSCLKSELFASPPSCNI